MAIGVKDRDVWTAHLKLYFFARDSQPRALVPEIWIGVLSIPLQASRTRSYVHWMSK